MSSILRVIETDEYRLVHKQLETGEQYFTEGPGDSPTIIRTVASKDMTLTPHSVVSAYAKVGSNMVFLTEGGITVVKTKPRVFLLKTIITGSIPAYPVPFVAPDASPATIRELADKIRVVASLQRLLALEDLKIVLNAFTATVDTAMTSSIQETHKADIDFARLLVDSSPSGKVQMKTTLESYNKLVKLVDKLLKTKQVLEQLTCTIHRTSTDLNRQRI